MSKLNLSSMKIGPIYTVVHLFLESTIFSFQDFQVSLEETSLRTNLTLNFWTVVYKLSIIMNFILHCLW